MALMESLNTSVASRLGVGQRRRTGTIEVLPGQFQLPKFDIISRIVVVATGNSDVHWFLITLDHKFCRVVEFTRKFSYLLFAGMLPSFELFCLRVPRVHH